VSPFKPLSPSALRVLEAIAHGAQYGFDVMDQTELPSGTVYPALARLERDGLVRAKWESRTIAHREKRPPRRYCEVSAHGARAMTQSIEYYRALIANAPPTTAPKPARA
jgi:DNA-binding PadR family transcriptional regulator